MLRFRHVPPRHARCRSYCGRSQAVRARALAQSQHARHDAEREQLGCQLAETRERADAAAKARDERATACDAAEFEVGQARRELVLVQEERDVLHVRASRPPPALGFAQSRKVAACSSGGCQRIECCIVEQRSARKAHVQTWPLRLPI